MSTRMAGLPSSSGLNDNPLYISTTSASSSAGHLAAAKKTQDEHGRADFSLLSGLHFLWMHTQEWDSCLIATCF